jgi:hypothetical protein
MPNSDLLEAQLTYESLVSFDLDAAILNLDSALSAYTKGNTWQEIGKEGNSASVPRGSTLRYGSDNSWVYKTLGPNDSTTIQITNTYFGSDPLPGIRKTGYYSIDSPHTGDKAHVESAFAPIAEYYSKLININTKLQNYISTAAKNLANSDPRLLSEERYTNRIHPEESILARESSWGLIPELRATTIPYLIAFSMFMAFLSIFLVFQIFGFSGQIILPPSLTQFISYITSPVEGSYTTNPLILGGVSILLFVICVILIILYFRTKNTNK